MSKVLWLAIGWAALFPAVGCARQRTLEAPEARVPALIRALDQEEPTVRRNAARALGLIGSPAKEAIPALRAALRDRDPMVCGAAATALERVSAGAALPRRPCNGPRS